MRYVLEINKASSKTRFLELIKDDPEITMVDMYPNSEEESGANVEDRVKAKLFDQLMKRELLIKEEE